MSGRFYVTTPIYYVNAAPHLGHAYTTIVADVLARFNRIASRETYFLTGTDEHGDKMVKSADAAGRPVQELVDQNSGLFRALWPMLNISNDDFIRTTEARHKEVVKLVLDRVKEAGDIYFSEYEGRYCLGCERFYTERELVDGKCPDHQTVPSTIRESNYFFRMSRYQGWLIEHIRNHPDFIRPERYRNEVLSFLKEPLEDLCISRPKSRLTWGITLPFDENYVTYVWFDALINYISALGYPDGRLFGEFWPAAQHLIAKDILKPHGIYWPCMLRAAGIDPCRHLNVHGYWNVNEGKMSKSLGNVVKPLDLSRIYGLDAFRYFLLREMVFGLDSEFSEEALVGRINADLANDLGNLLARSLSMVEKYFEGEVPAPAAGPAEPDLELRKAVLDLVEKYPGLMENLGFHKVLISIWEVIGLLNRYIVTQEPWVLARKDRGRLTTVLAHLLEGLRVLSALLWPFMPETSEMIQAHLGLGKAGERLKLDDVREWMKERPVRRVTQAPHLFPRIEVKPGEERSEEEAASQKQPVHQGPLATLDDFRKLDIRIGVVRKAEPIKGSKKLLKCVVDIGEERTVVAGVAESYPPDAIVGKRVVLLANLQPARLMGVESQGMILAAEDADGVRLLTPDGAARPGSRVR